MKRELSWKEMLALCVVLFVAFGITHMGLIAIALDLVLLIWAVESIVKFIRRKTVR